MKVAVVFSGGAARKAGDKVIEGAREAGAQVSVLKPGENTRDFDLVFLGWSALFSFPKAFLKTVKESKAVCVFWVNVGFGNQLVKFVDAAVKENAKPRATFIVETAGPLRKIGLGTPSFESLIRLRGFAERNAAGSA
ncbi:MAG: hypothetical protein V1834_03570 [Candidatus Micrarchaeota archaeon]